MPRSSSISEARSPPLPPTHSGPGFSPYLGPSASSYAYAHPPPLGIFEPTGPSAAITDRSPNPSPMLMPTLSTVGGIAPLPSRATKLPPAAMMSPSVGSGQHQQASHSGHFAPHYSSANGSRSTLASSSSSPPSAAFAAVSGASNSNIPPALLPPPAAPLSKQHASGSQTAASTNTPTNKRSSASARDSKRRATHSQIERRRREKINDRLITLRNLVPACAREVEERRRIKAEEEEAARRVAKGLPPLSPTPGTSEAGAIEASGSAAAGSASEKAKRKRSRRRAAAAAAAAAAAEASGGADAEDKEEDLGLHKLEVLTHAIDYIYELQARIAVLESQVNRPGSLGSSLYASSIRSVSTALTSPVMSLHADSPIMAGFGRPPSGSLPMAGSLKSTAVSPLFEGFTVSGTTSGSSLAGTSRNRPPPLPPSSDSWRDSKASDAEPERDGDVSPVSLYGRVPSLSGPHAALPAMLLPPPAAPMPAPSNEASAAAAEALLSISVSPDTLRPVSNVRDAPLPQAGGTSTRKHPYARRTTIGSSTSSHPGAPEPHGSAASSFHHLQQDRAAAAAAVAGAKAARRQSQAQSQPTVPVPIADGDVEMAADAEMDDEGADTDMLAHADRQVRDAQHSNSQQRYSGLLPSQEVDLHDEDIGDDTDPLSEPHVDETGRLITPPRLELGDPATHLRD
ncbi:hypothetical protein OC834_000178 [Tilletia horrida]|nr:hypothetical protein OC834_000178 [Tilletia horrida]